MLFSYSAVGMKKGKEKKKKGIELFIKYKLNEMNQRLECQHGTVEKPQEKKDIREGITLFT